MKNGLAAWGALGLFTPTGVQQLTDSLGFPAPTPSSFEDSVTPASASSNLGSTIQVQVEKQRRAGACKLLSVRLCLAW